VLLELFIKQKWRLNDVAVKCLIKDDLSDKDIEDFMGETNLMRSIRQHPNVANLVGVCEKPLCLITEFYSRGSLFHFLHSKENMTIQLQHQIMKGIASGMFHLQSENVIHRDLAARNVLLSEDFTPKISDFGLSRIDLGSDDANKTQSEFGPLKWMSPELLGEKIYGVKSDVWSWGVTMIEIITREVPYPNANAIQVSAKVVSRQLKPEIPSGTNKIIAELLEKCFDFDAEKRPDFAFICQQLKGL